MSNNNKFSKRKTDNPRPCTTNEAFGKKIQHSKSNGYYEPSTWKRNKYDQKGVAPVGKSFGKPRNANWSKSVDKAKKRRWRNKSRKRSQSAKRKFEKNQPTREECDRTKPKPIPVKHTQLTNPKPKGIKCDGLSQKKSNGTSEPSVVSDGAEGPKTYVIDTFLDEGKRSVLKKEFPHKYSTFKFTDKVLRGHPLLYVVRQVLLDEILEEGKSYLDVGTSIRMRNYGVRIHGCNGRKDLHNHVLRSDKRFQEHLFKQPNLDIQDDGNFVNPNGNYTTCIDLAEECTCGCTMDEALFIHSIYYKTPSQIMTIISKTRSKTGTALIHPFLSAVGEYYNSKNKSELVYRRHKGMVIATADQNSHEYHHKNVDWLFMNTSKVFNTTNGEKWVLTWQIQNATTSGINKLVKFFLLPYNKDMVLDKPKAINRQTAEAKMLLQSILPEAVITLINQEFFFHMKDNLVTIPVMVLTRGISYMAAKEITDTTKKGLISTIRSKLRMSEQDEEQALMNALNIDNLAENILSLTVKTQSSYSLFKYMREKMYNKLVHRTFYGALYNTVVQQYFRVTAAIILLASIGLGYLTSILKPLSNERQTAGGLFIGTVMLLLFMIVIKAKSQPFHERLAESIYVDRKTLDCPGRLPPLWGTNQIESKFKTSGLKYDPKKKLEIMGDGRVPRKHQGTVVVGPTFHVQCAVFSPSQKNGIKAVKTRVLIDTPKMDTEHWAKCVNLFKPYINIDWDGAFKWSSPATGVDESTIHWYTYEEWVNRFPPIKRARINKARDALKDGLWNPKVFNYTGFVKKEKQMLYSLYEYTPTKPRMIYGVDWYTKAAIGPWTLSYTSVIKALLGPKTPFWYCSGYTVKTFNDWFQRALRHVGGVTNALFICSDFSKYDVTQGLQVIKDNVKRFEQAGIKFASDVWKYIKKSKLHTKLYGDNWKVSADGIQKSGDLDTSLSNTINVGNSISSFFIHHKLVDSLNMAILGDDNFTVASRSKILEKFGTIENFKVKLSAWVTKCGFVYKVLVTRKPAYAEFLSMKFYPVEGGWAVGKKPGRCLAKIGHMLNIANGKRTLKEWNSLFKGTLKSYLPTANHVPFLRVYIRMALEHLKDVDATYSTEEWQLLLNDSNQEIHKPNDETWEYFTETYDLDESDEKDFEELLRSNIKVNGFTCYIPSPVLQKMVDVENIL